MGWVVVSYIAGVLGNESFLDAGNFFDSKEKIFPKLVNCEARKQTPLELVLGTSPQNT